MNKIKEENTSKKFADYSWAKDLKDVLDWLHASSGEK